MKNLTALIALGALLMGCGNFQIGKSGRSDQSDNGSFLEQVLKLNDVESFFKAKKVETFDQDEVLTREVRYTYNERNKPTLEETYERDSEGEDLTRRSYTEVVYGDHNEVIRDTSYEVSGENQQLDSESKYTYRENGIRERDEHKYYKDGEENGFYHLDYNELGRIIASEDEDEIDTYRYESPSDTRWRAKESRAQGSDEISEREEFDPETMKTTLFEVRDGKEVEVGHEIESRDFPDVVLSKDRDYEAAGKAETRCTLENSELSCSKDLKYEDSVISTEESKTHLIAGSLSGREIASPLGYTIELLMSKKKQSFSQDKLQRETVTVYEYSDSWQLIRRETVTKTFDTESGEVTEETKREIKIERDYENNGRPLKKETRDLSDGDKLIEREVYSY